MVQALANLTRRSIERVARALDERIDHAILSVGIVSLLLPAAIACGSGASPDTVVWVAIIGFLITTTVIVAVFLLLSQIKFRGGGHCPRCGYDLRVRTGERCPECHYWCDPLNRRLADNKPGAACPWPRD